MAEIHVERKRRVGAWVWVLLLVLLIVAAVAYLWYAGYINLGSNPGTSMGAGITDHLAVITAGGLNGA